jgi:tetratricopeptide (TPR) repeat protein
MANLRALRLRPVFRFQRTQIVGQALGVAFQAFSQQEYPKAIEKFKYALQVDPYQPDVAYNLGVAYMMEQDYPSALTYLSQSLREGECTADLCYAMGTVLRHLGDYETADEFHSKARELDPGLFAGAV